MGLFCKKKKGGGDSEGDQISDKGDQISDRLFGVFSYIFIGVSVYLWCTCLCMHACVQHACVQRACVHHTCVHANCILAHTHDID